MDECEADHHTQEQLGVGVDFYEIRHKRLTTIDEPRDPLVLVVDTKILLVINGATSDTFLHFGQREDVKKCIR